MLKSLFLTLGVLALGQQASAAAYAPTIIDSVKATPVNAGINPDAFRYNIEAKVLVGTNKCNSKGTRVYLSKQLISGAYYITAMKRPPSGERPICAQVWEPVYRTVKVTVSGFESRIKDVFIRNLKERDAIISVKQLLAPKDQNFVTLDGLMIRIMGAGAESTGVALETSNGDLVELDAVSPALLSSLIEEFDGMPVTVSGHFEKRKGTETDRRVLIVEQAVVNTGE